MTKIEWVKNTDGSQGDTWNPITGCTRISPGCIHCYAETLARRLELMGQPQYQGTIDKNNRWSGKLNFVETALDKPLKRKQPTTYFVNSMSDLFHETIPFEWLDKIWQVMSRTPQHTYQILTKRAHLLPDRVQSMVDAFGILPNVWLGVSVENQHYLDLRILPLSRTPAAIRFLSCEPLLTPLHLNQYLGCLRPGVDWVIVGGESGHGARPFDPEWALDIIKQCSYAHVACFVKQLGSNCLGQALVDSKGGDMAEWPEVLRVREFPGDAPSYAPAAMLVQGSLF